MCIATIETVILTLETLETAKIEFLGVHARPVLVLNLVIVLYESIRILQFENRNFQIFRNHRQTPQY